jgi:16S rRNA (guanine1207-N2)-methyltransferase
MTRTIHRSTLDAFERVVGPTRTSLAHRKARLVHSEVDPPPRRGSGRGWPRTDHVDELDLDVVSHAGAFSAGRLDAGTRLLLAHLPGPGAAEVAVDLGCGTGIVGTVLARADPDVHVTFVDESRLAVASAAATVQAALGGAEAARRTVAAWGDGLDDLDDRPPLGDASVDLVVVNPPFHRDHSIGDATAWRMFRQARRVLRPGGELLVVGNRHLGYHAKLRRLFGGCEVAGSDPRFVVLRARR